MIRNSIIAILAALCITVGIVVITPLVSSPDHAKCSAEQAAIAGIRNFQLAHTRTGDTGGGTTDATFFNEQGMPLTLADYRGKALLVNFWATWCAPCVAEMPALDRLQNILADTGIEVLTINEDRNGKEIARAFFTANNLRHLDILLDRNQQFIRAAGVTGLPTTLMIHKQGQVLASVLGDTAWDDPRIVSFIHTCLEVASGV